MDTVLGIAIILVLLSLVSIAILLTLAYRQARDTHVLINSRMDQLIDLTRKNARQEGIDEEKLRHTNI